MRKPLSTSGTVLALLLAIPALPALAADPPKDDEEEGPRRRHQHAARRRPEDRLRDERGNLDVGRRLARRADDRLRSARRHLRDADRAAGRRRRLTSGPAYDTQPRFSPDGKTIAFTSDRSGIDNIWLMDADGKNPQALTTEKDSYVRSAAWTPDGST